MCTSTTAGAGRTDGSNQDPASVTPSSVRNRDALHGEAAGGGASQQNDQKQRGEREPHGWRA